MWFVLCCTVDSTSRRKSLSKAQMTQKEYYSMTKRMGDKNSLNKMNSLREVYSERGLEEMNFEAVPKRAGEQGSNLPVYLGVGVGIAALAAGSATFSKTGGGASGEVGVIESIILFTDTAIFMGLKLKHLLIFHRSTLESYLPIQLNTHPD